MLYRFLFLFLSLIPPQTNLSLSGSAATSEGTPVPDALVVIENAAEARRWEFRTTPTGAFKLEQASPGAYTVEVSKEGFFTLRADVRLETSKTIEFTLSPSGLSETIEVVDRPEPINVESAAASQTVNQEAIQSLPFSGRRNFLNALALMPGVINDNSGGLHIHGSDTQQIRYQLDGINITDPGTGYLAARIPIDSIESVDLDLAGYSAEAGKGSGGVVRVNSQFIQDRFRWNLTDFLPGINFQRKTIGQLSPRFSFSGPIVRGRLSFLYSGSLRYVRTYLDELVSEENRQTENVADQLLKFQWNVAESDLVTINILHNSSYRSNIGLALGRPADTTTNTLQRSLTGAVLNRAILGRTILETTFQWTRGRDSESPRGLLPMEIHPGGWSGNFYSEQRSSASRFHAAQTVARQEGRHRMKAGFELDVVHSALFLERRSFSIFDNQGITQAITSFVGPTDAQISDHEYGAFVQDRFAASKNIQVELGLRIDRQEVIGRNNLGPRLAVIYLPLGSQRAKLSGGVGTFYDSVALRNFQLPGLQRRDELTAYVDPNLKNPYGIHWNASWDQDWGRRWVTRLNYVQKFGRDQIRIAAPLNIDNSGASRYRSVELSLDRPIRSNLRLLASYVYAIDRARPSLSMDFPDPSVDAMPEALTAWDVRHRFLAWGYFPFLLHTNASFSVEARSGFPYTSVDSASHAVGPYNGNRLPVFAVVNASFEREASILKRRFALRLGVLNLLNRFNPRSVDTNVNSPTFGKFSESSGRSLVARVRIVR